MKNTVTPLAAVLALALAAGSCGGGSDVGGGELEFDSIMVDTTVFLDDGPKSPSCHLRLSVTYAIGPNADNINDSIIRSGVLSPDYLSLSGERLTTEQAVDSFTRRYLDDYLADYGALYRADRTLSCLNCEYFVGTEVKDDVEGYYTYIANVYNYGGGAHGNSVVITKNIDARTGKILGLKDLFLPGYEGALEEAIVRDLCEQYGARDLDALRNQHFFMGIDPYAPDNFIIGRKDITFIYSPDEIAPHAVGEIRASIRKDDIKSLLKK